MTVYFSGRLFLDQCCKREYSCLHPYCVEKVRCYVFVIFNTLPLLHVQVDKLVCTGLTHLCDVSLKSCGFMPV